MQFVPLKMYKKKFDFFVAWINAGHRDWLVNTAIQGKMYFDWLVLEAVEVAAQTTCCCNISFSFHCNCYLYQKN